MKCAKCIWPVLRLSRKPLPNIRSSQLALISSTCKNYSTEHAQAQDIVSHEKIQLTKPSCTKWKRPPFMKGFFYGKFDTELLNFPEILDNEKLFELENIVQNLQKLMKNRVNSMEIDENRYIPDDILQELKDMGLFGRMIPSKYGGLDLTHTACVRLNEVLGLDWSLFCTLAAHEFLATEAILKFGTDYQKDQYLPKMASGEIIGAFCGSEAQSGNDLWSISTTAEETGKGSFIIDGTKSWVTNAHRAGVFIVFAKTKNDVDSNLSVISAFIIDKDTKGVKISNHNKTCLRGLETGVVQFENVEVPISNVLKGVGEGFLVYLKCLEAFRIAQNTFTFGTLKAALDSITERVIHIERLEESLADKQLIRRRLSKINSVIYGMESMAYFTAALLDSTEYPDVELESIALKLFNSRGTLYCLQEMMELVGTDSFLEEIQLERLHRDARGLAMFDAPNDIARLQLSFSGLKNTAAKNVEDIIKVRNPFFFPWNGVKAYMRRLKITYNYFKYNQDIAGHIHPSLVAQGNKLEEKIQIFEVTVENILGTHGRKVVDTQLDPRTLADAATYMYAISAVLSRCSRSYCIGLKNCHHELTLAVAFCYDFDFEVLKKLDNILSGANCSNEANHLLIGTQVVDCRGYFAESPLKHNW